MAQLNRNASLWADARLTRVVETPITVVLAVGGIDLVPPTAADMTLGASPNQVFVPWVNLVAGWLGGAGDVDVIGARVGGAAVDGWPYRPVRVDAIPAGVQSVIHPMYLRVEKIPVTLVAGVPTIPACQLGHGIGALAADTDVDYCWEIPNLDWAV